MRRFASISGQERLLRWRSFATIVPSPGQGRLYQGTNVYSRWCICCIPSTPWDSAYSIRPSTHERVCENRGAFDHPKYRFATLQRYSRKISLQTQRSRGCRWLRGRSNAHSSNRNTTQEEFLQRKVVISFLVFRLRMGISDVAT